MSGNDLSRRRFLIRAIHLPAVAGVLWLQAGCGASQRAVCFDPKKLSANEKSLRASLRYTDELENATQQCRGCAFFRNTEGSTCGTCEILSGPVNAAGHCDSWSARS